MQITRRTALRGGTAAAMCTTAIAVTGGVLSASALADVPPAEINTDPVVALHKEFKSLVQEYFLHPRNDAHGTALWDRVMGLRDQIIDASPTTSEGLARKLLVYSDWWIMGYRREEFLSRIVDDACCLANTPRPKAYLPAESRELKSRRPSFDAGLERLAGEALS